MIGIKKYALDPKTMKIFKGTVIGEYISDNGYLLIRLLLATGETKSLESAHVHNTLEEVEEHLKRVRPLIEGAEQIIKEATEKVDKLRLNVIGKPMFLELAEQVKGK